MSPFPTESPPSLSTRRRGRICWQGWKPPSTYSQVYFLINIKDVKNFLKTRGNLKFPIIIRLRLKFKLSTAHNSFHSKLWFKLFWNRIAKMFLNVNIADMLEWYSGFIKALFYLLKWKFKFACNMHIPLFILLTT